jgi:hypothetical protein
VPGDVWPLIRRSSDWPIDGVGVQISSRVPALGQRDRVQLSSLNRVEASAYSRRQRSLFTVTTEAVKALVRELEKRRIPVKLAMVQFGIL